MLSFEAKSPNRKTGSNKSKIVCKHATKHDIGGWIQPISVIGTVPEPLGSSETCALFWFESVISRWGSVIGWTLEEMYKR